MSGDSRAMDGFGAATAATSESGPRSFVEVFESLVTVQRTFVGELQRLLDAYLKPLRASKSVPEEKLTAVFLNLEELLQANQRVLAAFQDFLSNPNASLKTTFKPLLESLPQFQAYWDGAERAVRAYAELMAGSALLKELETKYGPLLPLMSSPVSQSARLHMMITGLVSALPAGDPDATTLQAVLVAVKSSANETYKRHEEEGIRQRRETLGFDASLVDGLSFDLLSLDHEMIGVKKLFLHENPDRAGEPVDFVLFTDCFVVVAPAANGRLRQRYTAPLVQVDQLRPNRQRIQVTIDFLPAARRPPVTFSASREEDLMPVILGIRTFTQRERSLVEKAKQPVQASPKARK